MTCLLCRLPKKYLEASQALSAASKSQDRSNGNTQSSNGTQHPGHPEELDTNSTPLLVFINVGSGGHVGEELSRYFQTALGSSQVAAADRSLSPQSSTIEQFKNRNRQTMVHANNDSSCNHFKE